jgi:hypothetical protein
MHDGFGTIKDGYFIPHSHVVSVCTCGRLLLLPAGTSNPDDALAVAHTNFQPAGARDCCR